MSVVRRFLVAPALVRLLRKERGGSRITEGYFPPQAGRTSYVRVDGQQCHLVLITTGADKSIGEERTDVPRAHGEALLDVCSGKAAYDRTTVALGGGREAQVDRYSAPGTLDLVSVTFETESEANAFAPPPWFGTEVTSDPAYERHAVAIEGPPRPGEVGLNNAALEAVLDLIEPRFGFGRYGSALKPSEDDGGASAARRMVIPAAAPAVAAAAIVIEAIPEPAQDETPAAEPQAAPEAAAPPAEAPGDTRIDDVFESLSQALGTAIRQPQELARPEDGEGGFERWTVRPRRTQQT
ncbi:MAG TPA: hypothetical protein VF641_07830 [Methylobacterium sp.]